VQDEVVVHGYMGTIRDCSAELRPSTFGEAGDCVIRRTERGLGLSVYSVPLVLGTFDFGIDLYCSVGFLFIL